MTVSWKSMTLGAMGIRLVLALVQRYDTGKYDTGEKVHDGCGPSAIWEIQE